MWIDKLQKIVIHFITFGFSFYALSSLDLAKILLPSKNRTQKAQLLLVFLSLALGYLVAQFILAIMWN